MLWGDMMINKLFQDEKAQALVEMALVLPILIMLVFGIVEFGRIYSTQIIVANSAREGARHAALGSDDNTVVTVIKNYASILEAENMLITISPNESFRQSGNSVTIHVEYPIQIYAPVISSIIGNPFNISSENIMRVE